MTKFVVVDPDIRIPITFEENVEWWMNTYGFSRPTAEQWVAYWTRVRNKQELWDARKGTATST